MKRVLIVNRGEIAIRVAKALRELGMTAVGLYTGHEPEPIHLQWCDEWVELPGDTHAQTYLNQEALIEIVKSHNIDGVHPGYGFLAENAEFARRVQKSGAVFIGPHPEAIELMGDKAVSKQVAHKAGVPTIPGSKGEVSGIDQACKLAEDMGFPVLLKAVAGGGGKGMRKCGSLDEVKANFESVQREALSSFGNAGLLVEKFIENPHHIEVQILGTKKGQVFHCFERECSVQRRHQKIIEEAPSPFIADDDKLREQVCQTAVELAKAVNYDSAGTVELIMGEDRKFYFLEMNTRIQVEHPITEQVTGVDLVANMILAAFEMPLDIQSQDDITLRGHSIECRICMEDPKTMLPAPGKIEDVFSYFPQGVRFDHCMAPGLTVTPDFDPMVGKLVITAINRPAAIRKTRDALDRLAVIGPRTNIPLHKKILDEETFVGGNYDTHYIEKIAPQDELPDSLGVGFETQMIVASEFEKVQL